MKRKKPFKTLLSLTTRLFPTLGDCVYETIYFIQRGMRGWSTRDCWNVDSHLSEIIPEMLRWLKENKHGVPNDFVKAAKSMRPQNDASPPGDYADSDLAQGEILYNAMLDEIIDGFESYRKVENRWECTAEEFRENEKIWRAKFLRGMELLTKHYETLWD
ncbi:MAG TPA: hypothetical protein PLY73_00045 [Candidatus Ozemobacteraceae bacterium]|nr:hypothetical protein [Candidatus Ozemobacteraceae bacterium]